MTRPITLLRPVEESGTFATVKRHEFLARDGELQQQIYRLEEGWACRYKLLSDGRRQIVTLFLPGDFCEPQWMFSPRAECPIVALTPLRMRVLPLSEIDRLGHDNPVGLKAMLSATMTVLSRQGDWIVSLGRRSATERVCDLLRDVFTRMQSNGRVIGGRCAFPLTQYDIADFTGLTSIHVNRVLKSLKHRGLIELDRGGLKIADLNAVNSAVGT